MSYQLMFTMGKEREKKNYKQKEEKKTVSDHYPEGILAFNIENKIREEEKKRLVRW